jgi:hypothetical protein
MQSLAVGPVALLFILMAPFLLAHASVVAASNLPFRQYGFARWPWLLTLLMSVLLTVTPIIAIGVTPVSALPTGTAAWGIVVPLVWAVHTLCILVRWRRREPLGDFLLVWYMMVGAVEGASGIVAAVELRNGDFTWANHAMRGFIILHALLTLPMAITATLIMSNAYTLCCKPDPTVFQRPKAVRRPRKAAYRTRWWQVWRRRAPRVGAGGTAGLFGDAAGDDDGDAETGYATLRGGDPYSSKSYATEATPLVASSPRKGGAASSLLSPNSKAAAAAADAPAPPVGGKDGAWAYGGLPIPAEAAAALAPIDYASFTSRLTFWWMQPLMKLGYSRPLEAGDLPPLSQEDCSAQVLSQFEASWTAAAAALRDGAVYAARNWRSCWRRPGRKGVGAASDALGSRPTGPAVVGVLVRAFGANFWAAMVFKLTYDCLQFTGPLLLDDIVSFLEVRANCASW